MLQRMERVKAPVENYGKIKIHFKEAFKSGKDVIFAENLSKSFGYGSNRKTLFSGVNLDIKRGEKICIVGANGIGKTSLIKIINGELEANEGTLKRGHNVEMAYYDQEQQYLKSDNTVFEEMKEAYRLYGDTWMRSILGRFLFKGDDIFLKKLTAIASRLGKLPTREEYLKEMGIVDSDKAGIYRYMNFDQIPEYAEVAEGLGNALEQHF